MPIENGQPGCFDGILQASRNQRIISRWINDKVVGSADPTVLIDGPSGDQPGIYYNIPENMQLIVTDVAVWVTTLSDNAKFEFGICTAINGGGTFVPQSVAIPVATENKAESSSFALSAPGQAIRYSDDVRSVTWRVTPNDTDTTVTIEWRGFIERE
jgi:hypothetical protein